MLPARFEQASFSLAEINNAKFTRPAVSSGMSVGSFPEQRLVIEPLGSPAAKRRKREERRGGGRVHDHLWFKKRKWWTWDLEANVIQNKLPSRVSTNSDWTAEMSLHHVADMLGNSCWKMLSSYPAWRHTWHAIHLICIVLFWIFKYFLM